MGNVENNLDNTYDSWDMNLSRGIETGKWGEKEVTFLGGIGKHQQFTLEGCLSKIKQVMVKPCGGFDFIENLSVLCDNKHPSVGNYTPSGSIRTYYLCQHPECRYNVYKVQDNLRRGRPAFSE
jgi:hypothetical protein